MKNRMRTLLIELAAPLLGVMLTLSFAPYGIFPFAVIAPAGLLLLWLNVGPKRAFWLGYSFGLGWFGSGVYWVFISVHVYGMVITPIALIITVGFIACLAVFPAVVGYLLNRYFVDLTAIKILCAFPAIWVFTEWVRSWIFTGFPWLLLGYSQTSTPLKGYAPIFSVYGVSLATIMSSALLVQGYLHYKNKEIKAAYLQVFSILTIWLIGGLITFIPWTKDQGRAIQVSLVQGNIPQQIKWSPTHLQLSYDRYRELTEPLWQKSQLIVWPESAIPTTLQEAATYVDYLNTLAEKNNTTLLLGIPIEVNKPLEGYYNSIISLGKNQQFYLKRQLVPFGEFTPFSQKLLGLFSFLNIPMSDMLPGKIIQQPFVLGDTKILPAICYEIAFPELMNTNDEAIGIILTVTNDAWFGKSAAQAQHLQMAAMRSLELKRPGLFVSNNGITAIIAADGSLSAAIPAHETAVLNGSIQPRYGLTPWMTNRMSLILTVLVFLLFLATREKYKKHPPKFWKFWQVKKASLENNKSEI